MAVLPDYPLEQIIAIKKKRVKEAEAEVKKREAELEQEREKLRQAEAERDKVQQHLQDKVMQLRRELDEGTTSDKIIAAKRYITVVQERLEVEERKVQKQKEQVALAEQRLIEAKELVKMRRKEVEKIQTHKKEWIKEQLKEIERLEVLEQDEIGQIMFARTHKERKAEGR